MIADVISVTNLNTQRGKTMAKYDIKITEEGDVMGAIIAAITVAKSLQLEHLFIDFQEGFRLAVSKDSKPNDIYKIHQLTSENKKLKKATPQQ